MSENKSKFPSRPQILAVSLAGIHSALPAAAECLISPSGIGNVSLGQNLKQVRQKFPKAKFKR